MKSHLQSFGIGVCLPLLICVGLFASPHIPRVQAKTLAELQAEIQSLLVQIGALQETLNKSKGIVTTSVSASIPTDFSFTRPLRVGSTGKDVRYLQILLNRDRDTAIGRPGTETEYFGTLTEAGVRKLQRKYEQDVLRPARLSFPTGVADALTLAKLNTLIGVPAHAQLVQEVLPQPPVETAHSRQATKPISFETINTNTRKALVNIICTTVRSGPFSPLSGSGVIIDDRGIILTNAHVAEYFLLKDYLVPNFIDCVIRTGEPARNAYRAKLMYISPLWIEENYKKIKEDAPSGTGEHDFALLLITNGTNPKVAPPKEFPFVTIDVANSSLSTPHDVLVAAYPAGFLGGVAIQRDLYPVSSIVRTGGIFGFDGTTVDTFSIGGSPLAQHGSSGGAVVDQDGELLGIIVTSTDGATTGERDLHAITTSHILRSFKKDTGHDLFEMLSFNPLLTAESFATEVAPGLTTLLENVLEGRADK